MTDPWADVRERDSDTDEWLERNWGWADTAGAGPSPHRLAHEDRKRILADADALLAMTPFARHKKECQIARAWGNGPGGTFTDPHCNCGYEKALVALPKHLRRNEAKLEVSAESASQLED